MTSKSNVVVVGAGVVGLTTALVLARKGVYDITVISKHMPGDYDIEYTSPWAGANWLPMAPRGTPQVDYETISFHELWHLTHNVPEAGIHVQRAVSYLRANDADPEKVLYSGNEFFLKDAWCKDLAPEFRELRKDELPEGFASGTSFQSMCINTQIYLPWLVSQCLKLGVKVKRSVLAHICEAADMHHSGKKADVVVNCTGLMARKLGGVMDESVYPARGQVVVVRNESPGVMYSTSSSEEPNEITYIMTRAAGGGTIIGGTYHKDNWESQPDPNIAQRLMKRALEICPQLVKPGQGVEGLSVIRHGVGLRPSRKAGPRIEGEVIDGVKVVHNYGAGGYGYQASYGMAEYAARCVEQFTNPKSRL